MRHDAALDTDAPEQQQVSQQLSITLEANARCTAVVPGAAALNQAYVTLSLRTVWPPSRQAGTGVTYVQPNPLRSGGLV